nr:hypothetical protein B0A51_06835 [Rachicladosporium sp. CCFEE 5018]
MAGTTAAETTTTTSESPSPQHDPPFKVTGGGSLLTTGNFADNSLRGGYNEATSGRINLSCDDEDALNELIAYLYTNKYPDLSGTDDMSVRAFLHLRIHILADKYNLPELVTQAADAFMLLANVHYYDAIFGPWLTAVLEETPPTSVLRQSMFTLVRNDVQDLMSNRTDEEAGEALDAALIRGPEFTLELLKDFMGGRKPATSKKAPEIPAYTTSSNRAGKAYAEKRI